MVKYSKIVYRIFLPLLGIIICSIVVATRSGQSPALFNGNYSYTAGMEIVAFLVVMGIATFFGFIIGLVINIFHQTKSKNSEQRFLEST